jgi:DNA replication protein DnaC
MIMERTEVLNLMGQLKLFGMKNAYDEILATALKRQHEPQRFAGDLLKAEISEKQARSIKYQLTIAKLPLAKDVDGFEFKVAQRPGPHRFGRKCSACEMSCGGGPDPGTLSL